MENEEELDLVAPTKPNVATRRWWEHPRVNAPIVVALIGALGVIIAAVLSKADGSGDVYINIPSNKGDIQIALQQAEISQRISEQLSLQRDEHRPNRNEVRELAKKYHLLRRPKVNPQLRFKDGDIAFFAEQNLSTWEIELEFMARRLILDQADEKNVTILDQGALSASAQSVIPVLYNKARERWDRAKH